MLGIRRNSLSYKTAVLYVVLTIVIVSIFNFIIWENQSDLITRNQQLISENQSVKLKQLFLKQRDLIKEDVRNHQFRMQEIVDPESGEHLKTFEHEVRGLFHPMYRREMVNRNASQNMAGYARGHDALIPSGA